MKIQVNEQALTLPSAMNIEQLLTHLEKPLMGSAVAVNMQVINRSEWNQYDINEGDNISLFQAIAGG
ncbi:sulfur carrier protein ThiS [Psychromonas aquatilis]|uniref:Sulfur carrier protein ThiS n=1 Tax=Psychromonas aquatilis TaxID=2005072 RepID=A0ABU9GNX5_9GAMM